MQAALQNRVVASRILRSFGVSRWLKSACAVSLVMMSLETLPAFGHMIASPGLPARLNELATSETAVKFAWPTEQDERLRPLEEGRFSLERMTFAGVPSRFNFQFDLRELSDERSEQPFALGAPFGGRGLFGFRFYDFGPIGQEFARSQTGDQEFGGFIPLSEDFGGFGRFGNRGGNGANRNSKLSALASGGAGDGTRSIDPNDGAYSPFAFRYLYANQAWGGAGGGDGTGSGDASTQLIAGMGGFGGRGFGDLHIGLFDGDRLPFDFGVLDIFGFPLGGPIYHGLIDHLYSGCGPFDFDILTPILGLPIGIVGPFLGPVGPFDWPFWLFVHHHHHPQCVPAPSSLVLLLSLIPNLGLAYGVRRVVRSRRAKKKSVA